MRFKPSTSRVQVKSVTSKSTCCDRCPKVRERTGILIIFPIFIYRLKLKAKWLKMALTLDKTAEIVLLSCRKGGTQRQVADKFNVRHPELQTVMLLSIPIC
jgi:hypothetical protein